MNANVAAVNRYLDYLQHTLRRRPSSVYKYRCFFGVLVQHLGSKPLGLVTHRDLEAFILRPRNAKLLHGAELSPATMRLEITMLRGLFKFLHSHLEIIASNPAERLVAPAVHNEDPHPVPEALWRRVWFSDTLSDAERVALGLGYFCGLRRFEIVGLAACQFVDVPVPLITGIVRKGGRKQGGLRWQSCVDFYAARLPRLIGDPALFVEPLTRLRAERATSSSLLPWIRNTRRTVDGAPLGMVRADVLNRRLDIIAERLGITEPFAPHDLRHSFVTNLCAAKVPVEVVSRLAGHSDVRITMRYVDVGSDPLAALLAEDAADQLAKVNRYAF